MEKKDDKTSFKNYIGYFIIEGLIYLNFFILLNYFIKIIWELSDILKLWSIADFFRLDNGLFSDVFFIYRIETDSLAIVLYIEFIAYFYAFIKDASAYVRPYTRKIWELNAKLTIGLFVGMMIIIFLDL